MSHLEKAREWGLGWKLVSYIQASSSQTRGSSVPKTHLMREIPAARPSVEGRGVTDTDGPGPDPEVDRNSEAFWTGEEKGPA